MQLVGSDGICMRVHTAARVLLAVFLSYSITLAQTSPGTAPDGYQTAKIVSVRQLKQVTGYPMSRYPTVARFTVDFALRLADQSICTGYETPVLDEVQDLVAANGQTVKVEIRGKKITMILPNGRKIHADLVKETQC